MIKETFTNLAENKRAHILSKAHHMFATQGFEATTIRDIVRLSKISRGSFYQYFDDLVDVFNACLNDVTEKKLVYMDDLMSQVGQIPFIKLYALMMEKGIDFAYAFKDEALSIARVFRSPHPDIQTLHQSIHSRGITMYESLIEADKASGFMDPYIDTHVLAKTLYSFNEHVIVTWFEAGMEKSELTENAHHFLTIINQGIE